jgi:hypothetical protein
MFVCKHPDGGVTRITILVYRCYTHTLTYKYTHMRALVSLPDVV